MYRTCCSREINRYLRRVSTKIRMFCYVERPPFYGYCINLASYQIAKHCSGHATPMEIDL